MTHPLCPHSLHRFWNDENGVVTIEFVIIFPLILILLAFIAFVSFAIAAQSEVQQVAFELARFGMIIADDPGFSGDICTKLGTDYLPQLIANSVTLNASAFQALAPCPDQPDTNSVFTVSVTYDLAGSIADVFSEFIGVKLGEITRHASVIVQ
jgi:Flp pilus assembly pilin Flp